MQSYCACVFAFLLLGVTKLVSSVGESGSSSPLLVLSTSPENGSVVEFIADGETSTAVSCHFISSIFLPTENETAVGTVRWFLNEVEINFEVESQFPGVQFFVMNNVEKVSEISSFLTVIANLFDIALNRGTITCHPPEEFDSFDVFGLFNTMVTLRTVTIGWDRPAYTVDEDHGNLTICATAQGWTTSDNALSVPILSRTGTATQNEDFRGVSANLQFTKSSVCLDVEIFDDGLQESGEHFTMEMIPPRFIDQQVNVNVVLSTAETNISITDNDETPTINTVIPQSVVVSFQPQLYTVSENNQTVAVCLSTKEPLLEPITILLTTSDRSATAGEDYVALRSQPVRLVGIEPSCAVITVLPDERVEGDEQFLVRVVITENMPIEVPPAAIVTITDTTVPRCEEGSIRLSRRGALGGLLICFNGQFVPVCDDEFRVVTGNLACRELGFRGVDDPFQDGDSNGNALLVRCNGSESQLANCSIRRQVDQICRTLGLACQENVPIRTTLIVSFESTIYRVNERDSEVSVCLVLRTMGDLLEPITLTVALTTVGSTAVAGEDFEPISDTVKLTVGEPACLNISIIADDIVEVRDEAFLVNIVPDDGNVGVEFTQSSVTVIIKDAPTPTDITDRPQFFGVSFEESEYKANESDLLVTVCLLTEELPGPINLTLITIDQRAVAGEDYGALDSVPVPLRSVGRSCVNITIIPDDRVEGEEEFTVSIVELFQQNTTVVIIDTTVCVNGDLRLVDGSNNATGRLEICSRGKWGTVCDDLFDERAASVACRQLGFEEGAALINTGFPDGDLPTIMDTAIVCVGNESRLIDCMHENRERPNCVNSTSIGLICGELCTDGDVRFVEQVGLNHVEICHASMWVPVCQNQWDNFDATVVCRQSGHTEVSLAMQGFGLTGNTAITNVTCSGNELRVDSCEYEITEGCQLAGIDCDAGSPCPEGNFWCLESSVANPECISRDGLCNGYSNCSSSSDERDCIVVSFSEDRYTVGKDDESVRICVNVTFPGFPLFSSDSLVTVTVGIPDFTDVSSQSYNFGEVRLNFNRSDSTQCDDIPIVDDDVISMEGAFSLSLSARGENLYINTIQSILLASVIISDDCSDDSNYCEIREECLSEDVMCDGVLDCYETDGEFNTDESNCKTCVEGELRPIRLSESDFIVEVCRNRSFHQVCMDSWDHREASVVCRQLNINNAGISTSVPEIITRINTESQLVVFCYGNETDIKSCRRELELECSSSQDAAAVQCIDSDGCADGERRVVSSSDGNGGEEGRVEVCFNGMWGGVYSTSMWNASQVGVICRGLGYEPSGAVALQPARPLPDHPLSEVVWPVHIICNSSDLEAKLETCSISLINVDIPNPHQSFVAGFQCRSEFSRENCTEGDVRISELIVRDDDNSGLVEVCRGNSWHKLCSTFFNNNTADVICRQLGFPFKGASSVDLNGDDPIFPRTPPLPTLTLSGMCSGKETQWQECANPFPLEDGIRNQARRDTAVDCLDMSFARVSCEDQSSLFLNSPSENLLGSNSYIVEEGRIFELECTSNRDRASSLRLERQDGSKIITGSRRVTLSRKVTESDEGNYSCVAETRTGVISVRNFTIIVNRTMGNSSSSFFRLSLPKLLEIEKESNLESLNDLVLALINKDFEGAQEVNCSLIAESKRPEDLVRKLDRVECAVLNYPPVTDTSMVVNTAVEVLPILSPFFAFLTAPGEGFCNAENVGVEKGQVIWPETRSGSGPVIQICPGGQNRMVVRECINTNWTEADYNTCSSFSDIQARIESITGGNVVRTLEVLNSVAAGAPVEEQNVVNARMIANALNATALLLTDRNMQLSTEDMIEVVSSVIQILDSLLNWDQEVLRDQGSENVENYEVILVSLITSESFKNLTLMQENLALLARRVMAVMLTDTGLSFSVSSSLNGQPTTISDTRSGGDLAPGQIASITFPTSIFTDPRVLQGPLSVAVTVYEEPGFFPLPLPEDNNAGVETMVGTPVVSLMVAMDQKQLRFNDLNPPLVLNLAVTQINPENVTSARCVFWDFTREEWSTEGCQTETSNDNSQITCTCTHLTNFAALVDVCRRTEGCETSSEADFALGILSIIGVSLSLAGLIATIFTMLFFKILRKRDATKFHVQLCIAMFIMLLVFLVGIQKTSVYGGCVTVSLLIHYFTLVTVMWMGAEAVLMFQKLVIVFVKITTKYIIIVSFICWLTPLVPVIIPVAINPDYVIIEPEGDKSGLCFIGNTATFFAAFLGPILAIILFNLVVFIIVMVVLIRHKRKQNMGGVKMQKSKKERGSTIRLMISIFGIMSVFGLTWLFGALTVDKASLAFQIIFVILNSLQGFVIFIFFCVLGRDARELWIETLFCGRYKSSYLHPSSANSSANPNGRKNALLSSNTDSSLPVVEQSTTSETTGGSYAISYAEFSQKPTEKGHVTTIIDENLTPKPTTHTFKGDKDTENHANGTAARQNENGGGHLLENGGEEVHQPTGHVNSEGVALDSEEDDTERSKTAPELRARVKRYSTKTVGKHHVETYELDFDEENTVEV